MKTYSRFNLILLLAALVIFILPAHTQADGYKWLKTSKYKNIFVYTDFNECDFFADQLIETIRKVLLGSKIKPTISDSLVFQSTDEGDKSFIELITHKLLDNQKVFLHIYGKCIKYRSAYIYQFDKLFLLDRRYTYSYFLSEYFLYTLHHD